MILIGDIHTHYERYKDILVKHNYRKSIQVGDFGFKRVHELHDKELDPNKHKIVFGNHDYYPLLDIAHSCGNYSMIDSEFGRIFTIRGALSVDKNLRFEGVDWFEREQLSYLEMNEAIHTALGYQPDIIITHDCPTEAQHKLFKPYPNNPTSQGLQCLFDELKPKLWVFGHYHRRRDEVISGTRFVCLEEFGVLDLETIKF